MGTRLFRNSRGHSQWGNRIQRYFIIIGLLIVLAASYWWLVNPVQAQSPKCPPGFVWDRLSAIGCVQEDCFDVGGYYDGTNHCICPKGYDMCTEPVDYSSFDVEQCGPFCPDKVLTSCVLPPERCPSEIEVVPPVKSGGAGVEDFGGEESGDFPSSPGDVGLPTNFTLRQIEEIISGPESLPPTPARAVAGAALTTGLLGTWILVDWLRQRSTVAKEITDFGKDGGAIEQANLAKPETIFESGENQPEEDQVAASAIDMITSMSDMGSLLNAEKISTPEKNETDRWADEFMKGSPTEIRPSYDEDIPQAKASTPIGGQFMNPEQRVFDGDDAIIILKELGMVPLGTSRTDKISLDETGLDSFIGASPDGYPRQITLPSGKTIIVTKVEGILIGGKDDAIAGQNPTEIDFSKPVVITAELVEQVPKPPSGVQPTQTATPSSKPVHDQSTETFVDYSESAPMPESQNTVETPQVEESPGKTLSRDVDQEQVPVDEVDQADIDQDLEDIFRIDMDNIVSNKPKKGLVPVIDPKTDEVIYVTENDRPWWEYYYREHKKMMKLHKEYLKIIEELERLMRKPQHDVKSSSLGEADIIGGDEISSAIDDF